MKERSVGARISEPPDSPPESLVVKASSDFRVHGSAQTSHRATRVLVNGDSFAVFEVGGDILETPDEHLGFFHRDTRYLSRFELKIAGATPYYLNSYPSQENAQLQINLSNPDLGFRGDEIQLPRNSIQLERNWVIAGPALFHKLKVRNYARARIEISLDFLFGVDFADVFEVRGFKRTVAGRQREPQITTNSVTFLYQGLDSVTRFTTIVFESSPTTLKSGHASFLFTLLPDEYRDFEVRIIGGSEHRDERSQIPVRFADALTQRRSEITRLDAGWARISTNHESFDSLLNRSAADLTSMIRFAPEGTFLMAGIPWYATLFGRDSILTALFALPFNPALAVGTLKSLASLQGQQIDPRRDEQPGKIVHEIREGELAATGEVPFGRYYGSVDATPLFLCLLGRYVQTTGDLGLAEELWSNAERALHWIERWGDADGDIYVEYLRETPRGLANQGWKDSFDAISHADGTLARPPIALCEVQGYVYSAYGSIADVARRLGHEQLAARLNQRAAILRSRFSRDFWLEHERTVALALDADKRPCRVMTSNAGHCLAAGLLNREQAELVADNLMDEAMFNGWGVKTLSSRERRYNPMSYHNGSVWPHDNALVAAGLARAKRRSDAIRILEGLLQAVGYLNTGSLPELFCGFPRDERLGPVPYPVACHPQAWSAASIFMIVQTILGIEVRGFDRKLIIDSAEMPKWLDWIKIENLKVGDGEVSLIVRRIPEGSSVGIIERRGNVAVEFVK
ncbi:MAG: amylo-alpha-1,6-glucosidase [Deltaproteobacteria bacterium]|nr:amylo-alpha-1,6-glucosidase [Deltaproteobacteria bacterium]